MLVSSAYQQYSRILCTYNPALLLSTPTISARCIWRRNAASTSDAFVVTKEQLEKVEKFLQQPGVVIDVRAPKEYANGHIPNAHNIPLFNDEERHVVGKAYKEHGKDKAIELGLKLVGPKLYEYVRDAKKLQKTIGGPTNLYCARGGMRSGSMNWLFNTAGIKANTLPGGYKYYRHWVLNTLSQHRDIIVLAGMTGSGKTAILQELAKRGEQVIDLEGLANHKGSSYGANDIQPLQPTQEFFENTLAVQWAKLDPTRPVWVEDESNNVGSVSLPRALISMISALTTPVVVVERPQSERLTILNEEYGNVSIQHLLSSTRRLERKLGAEKTAKVVGLIEQGQLIKRVEAQGLDSAKWAEHLCNIRQSLSTTTTITTNNILNITNNNSITIPNCHNHNTNSTYLLSDTTVIRDRGKILINV